MAGNTNYMKLTGLNYNGVYNNFSEFSHMPDPHTCFRESNHNTSKGKNYDGIEYQKRRIFENLIFFTKIDTVQNPRRSKRS